MKTKPIRSDRAVDDIAPGDHVCLIYDNDDDYRDVMVPFVRQGLDRNQKVLFVTGQPTAEVVLEYLTQDEAYPVRSAIERGQLKVITEKAAYFQDGVFDPDAMISMLATETDEAVAAGYDALRVTGEMSWALGEVIGADRLIEYEIKLNDFYPRSRAVSICQYDTRRFDPATIMNVLQAHPYAILGTEFCDNVYYMPPEELFSDRASEFRLERWIDILKAYQAEKTSLQQALREKDQLMREINHRVKNSLNLVLSLIYLKERSSHSATDVAEIRSFIQTMCLVHDKLHRNDDSSRIEFAEFADELLRNVVSIFPGPPVTVSTDIPETFLGAENARNLGLILNELVTNAMKHGFNGEDNPQIVVRLDRDRDRYILTVSNNGQPFPDDISLDDPDSGGTGTRLVASIVEALSGSIIVRRDPKTEIHLEFPVSSLVPVE